jgi:hypothetical protein
MDDTTTTNDRSPAPLPVLQLAVAGWPTRAGWIVTPAGLEALATDPAGDLTREPEDGPPPPCTMSPMDDPDLASAFVRVDLLLDECLLTLHRSGYQISHANDELIDRLRPATARVQRRVALADEIRQAADADAEAGS